MMKFDRISLGKQAKELGFVRDTFEKVLRLADVLKFFDSDELLRNTLALKGGTAINLTIFDLPRLSVDIDLDFSQNIPKDEMLEKRELITQRISKYMTANGYALSIKSKKHHALDSFVYEYQNSAGMKDNIKIEINYMLRCHILPLKRRNVNLPWLSDDLTVLSVDPMEIFASKTSALLNRTAPRDLYDIHNLLKFGLFDESEQDMFRKCAVFYSCIGSEIVPKEFTFDNLDSMPQYKIKTDLLPVLRFGEYFDLNPAREKVKEYLHLLLQPTLYEKEFMSLFSNGIYKPELLFEGETLENILSHPMAIWKCKKAEEKKLDYNEYNSETGMPNDESHFECGLPAYVQESLERMKESWKIIDSGKKDIHWDICWCELNADLNSAEVEQLISSEQAWYLRRKYLRMENRID